MVNKEMVNKENTCPYCKEEIKPEAIKCKHCSSKLVKATPSHEGICPFCKESIKPDAMKCKHCKTSLATDSDCGCNNLNDVNGSEQARALRSINTKLCVGENGFLRPCGGKLELSYRPWWWDLDPKPQPDPWREWKDPHPADLIGPPIDPSFLVTLNEYLSRKLANR